MPCSLGSLGYVLSFWLDIKPIFKYIYSETQHYDNFIDYLNAIAMISNIDFLDGTIFSPTEFVLITGKNTNSYNNPRTSYFVFRSCRELIEEVSCISDSEAIKFM